LISWYELAKKSVSFPNDNLEMCFRPYQSLSKWEEENALRYVAGYVCRRVQESLKRSTRPDKEKMVLFMIHLSGDEDMEERGTETWIDSIDRGGLWYVNDITYTVFYHMEEEILSHIQVKLLDHMDKKTERI
jgi:hypothetical protein